MLRQLTPSFLPFPISSQMLVEAQYTKNAELLLEEIEINLHSFINQQISCTDKFVSLECNISLQIAKYLKKNPVQTIEELISLLKNCFAMASFLTSIQANVFSASNGEYKDLKSNISNAMIDIFNPCFDVTPVFNTLIEAFAFPKPQEDNMQSLIKNILDGKYPKQPVLLSMAEGLKVGQRPYKPPVDLLEDILCDCALMEYEEQLVGMLASKNNQRNSFLRLFSEVKLTLQDYKNLDSELLIVGDDESVAMNRLV